VAQLEELTAEEQLEEVTLLPVAQLEELTAEYHKRDSFSRIFHFVMFSMSYCRLEQIRLFFLAITIVFLTCSSANFSNLGMSGKNSTMFQPAAAFPSLKPNANLDIEVVTSGLSEPTGIAFVDNNTILILEKGGQVRLISNGQLREEPLMVLPVDSINERGLLGIAVLEKTQNHDGSISIDASNPAIEGLSLSSSSSSTSNQRKGIDVFLYFTELLSRAANSSYSAYTPIDDSDEELRNRVYKYEWQDKKLINPKLILDIPALPGPNHNGGKIAIGPDNFLYVIIGDLNHSGKLQNEINGGQPDDTSVILRVNPDTGQREGNINSNGSLFSINENNATETSTTDLSPYNMSQRYYAYGIRNSFGLAFDPISGKLWETENGYTEYDEINVVNPGFNSGWQALMGPLSRTSNDTNSFLRDRLVLFPGSHYSDPVFSWKDVVAPTAIEFLNSSKLGVGYRDNIFVGDYNNGNLYFFKLNETRNGISLDMDNNVDSSKQHHKGSLGPDNDEGLSDSVVDNDDELSGIVFGSGFGSITDIKTGPDGYLYILSFHDGILYRIVPSTTLVYSTPEQKEQEQSSNLNLSKILFPQAIHLINSKHQEWGGVNGSLGQPISNISITSDGLAFYRIYETGAIYWKIGGVPHEVHGSIYNKWKSMGSELSELGYPLTDERPSSAGDGGYFTLFEHGTICWTPYTGAHEIHGDIYRRWNTLGSELSELGYPLTDVQNVAEEGASISYFQGGSIRVFSNNGTVQVLHSKDYVDIVMGQNAAYSFHP
jgi:glucose/arabinose dehydrogenase